jgi:hypothetical protein
MRSTRSVLSLLSACVGGLMSLKGRKQLLFANIESLFRFSETLIATYYFDAISVSLKSGRLIALVRELGETSMPI